MFPWELSQLQICTYFWDKNCINTAVVGMSPFPRVIFYLTEVPVLSHDFTRVKRPLQGFTYIQHLPLSLCEGFMYPSAKTVCSCKAIILLRLLWSSAGHRKRYTEYRSQSVQTHQIPPCHWEGDKKVVLNDPRKWKLFQSSYGWSSGAVLFRQEWVH